MPFLKKLTIFICIFIATNTTLAESTANKKTEQFEAIKQSWYQTLSPEDQEKYTLAKYANSPNEQHFLVYSLSGDGRTDIILAAMQAGWFKQDEFDLISALLNNHQEQFLCSLLKDGLITQKDTVALLSIRNGKVDVMDKVLSMGLSKEEINSVNNNLSTRFLEQTVLTQNQDSYYQALAKFVNFASNHSSEFSHLYEIAHKTYSAGRIMHILKPEFVHEEIERCRNLIAKSSDISDEQKTVLENIYTRVVRDPDTSKIPCSLKDDDVRALYDLNLNIWQLIKYFPNTLFDTKSLLTSAQSTPTNYMLVNYLNSQWAADTFRPKSQNQDKNHHCESFMYQEGIYDRLLKIESEMEFEGYHTFVHGRCWNFNFANDMANLVTALAQGKDAMSNDIILASYDANTPIEQLQHQRQKILTDGSKDPSDGICMNSSILSHRENRSFFTGNYFCYNRSDSFQGQLTQYLFANAHMEALFREYQERLKKLHQMHKEASQTGELLAISIKNEKLSDLTYLAGWRAEKQSGDVNTQWYTTMQELYHAGCEIHEECFYYFALPDIPGERENRDYIVQSIHLANKQKYDAYQAELQNIFQDMKHYYMQHHQQIKK